MTLCGLSAGFDPAVRGIRGRPVACLATNESELPVGSEIKCRFDVDFADEPDVEFAGWSASGLAPPARDQTTATFHTEAPGPASITANWIDPNGVHSETLDYIVTIPHWVQIERDTAMHSTRKKLLCECPCRDRYRGGFLGSVSRFWYC
jgi:hypothetical protein